MEPALVLGHRDSVVAGHGLERLEVTTADGAEDRVVGKAGAVGDLVGGEDVALRSRCRRAWLPRLFGRAK